MLGVELDRLVVLTKDLEHIAFFNPVFKPTGDVKMLGEELDRLVVLA